MIQSGPFWPHDVTFTYTAPVTDRDGFVQTWLIYARGPGEAPGYVFDWTCAECGRTREDGHAPSCAKAKVKP